LMCLEVRKGRCWSYLCCCLSFVWEEFDFMK
jgi:hypothetical protein